MMQRSGWIASSPAGTGQGKLVVYVNPTAAGGRAGRAWQQSLRDHPGIEQAHIVLPSDAESAESSLDRALTGSVERVIAVGGDGTAHLVANRLLASDLRNRVAFGLVPVGTGSDFARALRLPKHPQDALAHALSASPRAIDVIGVTGDRSPARFVINIASIGISGAVGQATNAIPQRSAFTYLWVTVLTLLRYRPPSWRLWLDERLVYDGPLFVAAFANGHAFGGGMRVAPDAVIDDGLADLVVVPPVPRWTLPLRLPQFLRGSHVRLPFVRVFRGRTLKVEPRIPAARGRPEEPPHESNEILDSMPPFDLDGESFLASTATFLLHRNALLVAA